MWAPVNEALANVDMTDRAALERLVSNHIARYSNPTSTQPGKYIYMLNGKRMAYDGTGSFNGTALEEGNERAVNGILHKLSDTIPYRYNFYEYMSVYPEYSKVYEFILTFIRKSMMHQPASERIRCLWITIRCFIIIIMVLAILMMKTRFIP